VALHLLLECGNGPSVAGFLILTLVEQAQLEVGSTTPFYQLPFQQYGFFLTNCWTKSLWSFLSSVGLHLQASGGSGLYLQCANDICLMDALVSSSAFIPATLQSFNCCHLYMCCISLADISTGDGCHLHPPFYTWFSPNPLALSSGQWSMSAADWGIWQSTLLQLFCISIKHLINPLGD